MNVILIVLAVVILVIEVVGFVAGRRNWRSIDESVKKQMYVSYQGLEDNINRFVNESRNFLNGLEKENRTHAEAIATKNAEFIKSLEDEFVNEVMKAEQKKDDAVRELEIFVTAIKSLDDNYRKKIQFQVDRIISRPKKAPATKKPAGTDNIPEPEVSSPDESDSGQE
jgi:hypothetical protein